MKIKSILSAAVAVAFTLTSCGGPGEGKDLSELKDATTADSLSNLFGQQYALDFWNEAAADSAMTTPEAREQYLKGVADALRLSGKDDSYIRGYILGASIAQYKGKYTQEFGIDFSDSKFLDGLAFGLRNDSSVNAQQTAQDLNLIMTRVGAAQDKKISAEGDKNLAAFAKKEGLAKFGKDLYGKVTGNGSGNVLATGDRAEVSMGVTTADGKSLGLQMPSTVTVGRQFTNLPIGTALLKLKEGQQGRFATYAFALLGTQCYDRKINPAQPVVFTIRVNKVAGKEADDPAAKGVTPAEALRNLDKTQKEAQKAE